MKKLVLAAALLCLSLVSWAQTSGQDIYRKYSSEKRVTGVYISPSMFSLMKSLPDLDDDEVSSIRSLSGFYALEIENRNVAGKVRGDVQALVKNCGYELVMEAVDEGEKAYIYCMKEGEIIKSIILLNEEADETDFVCIEGELSQALLRSMMAEAKD